MSLKLVIPFFFSGAAGLIYQIVWVRQFGNIFGNTVHSASLVVAVFMCGLGLGGMLAGGWADRRYADDPVAPLRLYARVEYVIAALALVVAVALPLLVEASALFSRYATGPHGWQVLSTGSYFARYLIAVALLLPVTTMMGATLTLLIRFIVASAIDAAGYRIGLLYSANTLGAAAGAFLSDFLLIPAVGLLDTQLSAALLNLIAGLIASRLAARAASGRVAVAGGGAADASDGEVLPLVLVGAAIALAGFGAMGMEIVWFRHLSSMIGAYRSVFSLVLTVILVGIVVGSLAGGWIERRIRQPATIFFVAQACFVITSLAALWLYERGFSEVQYTPSRDFFAGAPEWARWGVRHVHRLLPMLYVVGVPAVFMGATFPIANACIQRAEATVGRRAGALYLANTFGGVTGSLATGFFILPALGSQGSVAVLVCVVAAGLPPMFLAMRGAVGRRGMVLVFAGALVFIVAGLGAWTRLEPGYMVKKSLVEVRLGESRLLAAREDTTELLAVTQKGVERALFTNGHPMSSTRPDAQRYMRAFSHLPLLMMDDPARVLVICFGVGNTLHAASLHPSVRELEVADLSQNVLEHAGWFAASNHDVLKDPRVRVFVNDGRQHLRMSAPGRYDLITLEPPPIAQAGVSALYSKEFYELARSRLKPGGFLTQWLPGFQVTGDAMRGIVRAFLDVFPNAVLLSGNYFDLILMGSNAPDMELDPARLDRVLAERSAVRDDLARVHLARPLEIAGTFAADAVTMAAATQDAPPITDDLPLMEYAEVYDTSEGGVPKDFFDVRRVASWCPACFVAGRPIESLSDLPAYLSVLSHVYLSARTIAPEKPLHPGQGALVGVTMPRAGWDIIKSSEYLRSLVK